MDADTGLQLREKLEAVTQELGNTRQRLLLLSQRAARLGFELEASASLRASMHSLSEKAKQEIAARASHQERDEWADDGRFVAMAAWEIALVGEDSGEAPGAGGSATVDTSTPQRLNDETKDGGGPADPSSR